MIELSNEIMKGINQRSWKRKLYYKYTYKDWEGEVWGSQKNNAWKILAGILEKEQEIKYTQWWHLMLIHTPKNQSTQWNKLAKKIINKTILGEIVGLRKNGGY